MIPIDWHATGFSWESFLCGLLVIPAIFLYHLYDKGSNNKQEGAWVFLFVASFIIANILVMVFNVPVGPK